MIHQPFAIPAIALFLLALPLVLGLIPRNRFYGFRTVKTLSKDEIWYPVNRLAGIALLASCALYLLVSLVCPYNRLAGFPFSVWELHLAAFVLPIIVGLILAGRYAKRLG